MAGLTAFGFDVKTIDQILQDMQTDELANISPSLDVQATALIGILNGIVAQKASELWQLGAALYNGMDPNQATGDQLTSDALLTGTLRLKATKTQVLAVTVNVNAGFSAAPGTLFASIVGNPAAIFVNKDTVTNSGGTPANETSDFEAVDTGPIQCLSGTLTVISVPVTGWNSVTNSSDGIVGHDVETDAALRIRRVADLEEAGSTTSDAIRSDVLAQMQPPTTTSETTNVTVLHNDTDITDANGVAPHAIEVIALQPGATSADNQLLANLIFADKAAGIGTQGNTSKSVTDSQGNVEVISFTRPTSVRLWDDITITIDANTFPADGDNQVKLALSNYVSSLSAGNAIANWTIYVEHVKAQAFTVPGVLDVTSMAIDTHSTPTNTANITFTIRQVPSLATGDINVTHT